MTCGSSSASATERGELRVGMVETFPQPDLPHTHLGATGPGTATRSAGGRALAVALQIVLREAEGLCPGRLPCPSVRGA